MDKRIRQVEANLRELLSECPDGGALLTMLRLHRRPATCSAARELQEVLRREIPYRAEKNDISRGRYEMLRRPEVAVRSGGDCDDIVAMAGIVWEAMTGEVPVGSMYLPDLRLARHVVLVVQVDGDRLATVDGCMGGPQGWRLRPDSILPWPEVGA